MTSQNILNIHYAVEAELKSAIEKFPEWPSDMIHAFAIVHEEIGEAAKDILQFHYEPHKNVTIGDIQIECLQSIAMLYRFLLSMQTHQYAYEPRLQHYQKG